MVLATMLTSLQTRPLVVGYVLGGDDLGNLVSTIDYRALTHINVAFANPIDDSGTLDYSSSNDALIKKAHDAGVKILVSIGGGSASSDKDLIKRYFYLTSPSQRKGFVQKIADYVTAHQYDGIDVDLEGPSINGDYGPFVLDLVAALRPKGLLVTAALSKGYGGENVPTDAIKAFDFVNVMAYDATGPWAPNRPGQHSSMDFAKENVAYWASRGLDKGKTILGVPFYGYGFGPDAKGDEWSYSRILAAYPGAEKMDQVGKTIYYNGIPTIELKARYVRSQSLGGVMIWSLNSDVVGANSLLKAIDRSIKP